MTRANADGARRGMPRASPAIRAVLPRPCGHRQWPALALREGAPPHRRGPPRLGTALSDGVVSLRAVRCPTGPSPPPLDGASAAADPAGGPLLASTRHRLGDRQELGCAGGGGPGPAVAPGQPDHAFTSRGGPRRSCTPTDTEATRSPPAHRYAPADAGGARGRGDDGVDKTAHRAVGRCRTACGRRHDRSRRVVSRGHTAGRAPRGPDACPQGGLQAPGLVVRRLQGIPPSRGCPDVAGAGPWT